MATPEKGATESSKSPKKALMEPRPSSSILLISPTNEILLLHRVQTSRAFPSAHVFPGGNLSASQDGRIPAATDRDRHIDGQAYRLGAIRECFEESGILLAKRNDGSDVMLDIPEETREQGRKDIHEQKIVFTEWVSSQGGIVDTDALIPFTRWVTPTNVPRRFTTQMYVYFLPISQSPTIKSNSMIQVPTHDGGLEHTAALFAPCSVWLDKAIKNEIILFPPQFYLMKLLQPFFSAPDSAAASALSRDELQKQRESAAEFLQSDGGDGTGVTWADKLMSPIGLPVKRSDGRGVLSLDVPPPELKESGRRGDPSRVVLVKFLKEGPRNLEIIPRAQIESQLTGSKAAKL